MLTIDPEPNRSTQSRSRVWTLVSLTGIAVFVILYVIATRLYPGGSQADSQATGFSWLRNYWCNLLNTNAINKQPNPARPVAIVAMGVLCCSLVIFWYQLPRLFHFGSGTVKLIRWTGILSMGSALFIFTEYHDLLINVAAFFGLITLVYTFIGLYRNQFRRLFWFGCFCLLLMIVNNYIYYSRTFIFFLPLIQKITFALFLSWIGMLTGQLYRTQKGQNPTEPAQTDRFP